MAYVHTECSSGNAKTAASKDFSKGHERVIKLILDDSDDDDGEDN